MALLVVLTDPHLHWAWVIWNDMFEIYNRVNIKAGRYVPLVVVPFLVYNQLISTKMSELRKLPLVGCLGINIILSLVAFFIFFVLFCIILVRCDSDIWVGFALALTLLGFLISLFFLIPFICFVNRLSYVTEPHVMSKSIFYTIIYEIIIGIIWT
jgi:hypothetical protein